MAQRDFSDAHAFTAKWEGGLSDHPADRGGITAYGASIEFVKDIAATPTGRDILNSIDVPTPITRDVIRSLRPGQVTTMFRHKFWDALKLDELPYRQAAMLYDAAVNHGPAQAVKLSQRGYNRCIAHGVKLTVDGLLGPLTRKALQIDTAKVVQAVIQARRDFYQSIVASKPDQRVFLKGWLNRANALEKMLLA